MKNTLTKLLPAVLLLLAVALSGCERSGNPLKNTEWKLYGFSNTADGTLQQAEPADCDNCYTIRFDEDGEFKGKSSINIIKGKYWIRGKNIGFTNITSTFAEESLDGYKYVEALPQVNRFEISSEQLKLYYGNTNYLLFKKR